MTCLSLWPFGQNAEDCKNLWCEVVGVAVLVQLPPISHPVAGCTLQGSEGCPPAKRAFCIFDGLGLKVQDCSLGLQNCFLTLAQCWWNKVSGLHVLRSDWTVVLWNSMFFAQRFQVLLFFSVQCGNQCKMYRTIQDLENIKRFASVESTALPSWGRGAILRLGIEFWQLCPTGSLQ